MRRKLLDSEKWIFYGMGAYAKSILKRCDVQFSQIEAIIDNSPESVKMLLEGSGIRVYTWGEFAEQSIQPNSKIIISSPKFQEEIRTQILGSGLFRPDQIMYIDEWYQKKYRGGIREWLECRDCESVSKTVKIKESALKNTRVLGDRSEALKKLPTGLIVVEIGVAYGDFSKKIFEVMQPEKFYGIDIFSESVKGFWNDDIFEKQGMTHLQWYKNRFRNEIEEGKFEVKQGLSWDVLAEFPDNYFDYAYLDAGHSYENVARDVAILRQKIKEGGIIQFNDYIRYDYMAHMFYGIVPVVNELIEKSNSEVLYYCLSENGFDDIVLRYQK